MNQNKLTEIFKAAMQSAGKNKGKFTLFVGVVKSIDGDVCAVDDLVNVRLNAVIDDLESQFTIYPVVGSNVVIARLEAEDDAFVVGVSEIDKVTIKIGKLLFEMH